MNKRTHITVRRA